MGIIFFVPWFGPDFALNNGYFGLLLSFILAANLMTYPSENLLTLSPSENALYEQDEEDENPSEFPSAYPSEYPLENPSGIDETS